MNVFEFSDYKKYLIKKIDQNQMVRGYRARLAEAAGCQKSFFSQVLGSTADLSVDHSANLAHFWEFTPEETSYYVDLVSLVRTDSKTLKQLIQERLRMAREKHIDLNERFAWPKIESLEHEAMYFSSWYWSAIHVITAIPEYRSVTAVANRLGLPVRVVEDTLKHLEQMGLVKNKKTEWSVTDKNIHLPRSSFMNEMNHLNWRQRAMHNIQVKDPGAIHYSLVFALSTEDFSKLREMVIDQIQRIHKLAGPSPSEELVCFTCDLFRI